MAAKLKLRGVLCLFFLLGMADVLLTYNLLRSNTDVYEGNPVAAGWLAMFGWAGLIALKASTSLVFVWVCFFLASRNSKLAYTLAAVGCCLVGAVILYSVLLSIAESPSGGALLLILSAVWAWKIPEVQLAFCPIP